MIHHWYAVRAKPRREVAASTLLAHAGIEVYLPQSLVHREHGRPPRLDPFFPGYFFGRLDAARGQVRLVRYTSGVLDVVGYGEDPWPVPDAAIAAIRARLAHGRARAASLLPGEHVVITKGPLKDLDAIFDRHLSATGRAQVLIRILERLCRTEISVEQLRRVS